MCNKKYTKGLTNDRKKQKKKNLLTQGKEISVTKTALIRPTCRQEGKKKGTPYTHRRGKKGHRIDYITAQ